MVVVVVVPVVVFVVFVVFFCPCACVSWHCWVVVGQDRRVMGNVQRWGKEERLVA